MATSMSIVIGGGGGGGENVDAGLHAFARRLHNVDEHRVEDDQEQDGQDARERLAYVAEHGPPLLRDELAWRHRLTQRHFVQEEVRKVREQPDEHDEYD